MNVIVSEENMRKDFAFCLKAMVGDSDDSIRKLSKESGIDRSTIYRYMAGERTPTLKNLYNLMYALDCEPEDLLEHIGSKIE